MAARGSRSPAAVLGGLTGAARTVLRTAGSTWQGTVRGRPSGSWTAADLPDQSGRTVLVTGSTSGLGLQVALALARRGARVLLTARDAGRGELARTRVAAVATGAEPQVVELDLADLATVRTAAARVRDEVSRLDALYANAGVMATPKGTTEDGFETQIGTNHLGHFALVGLLLPVLRGGRPPAPRRGWSSPPAWGTGWAGCRSRT